MIIKELVDYEYKAVEIGTAIADQMINEFYKELLVNHILFGERTGNNPGRKILSTI